MTKAEQILGYKEANPLHKAKDIAKACGVATPYVYQVLHNAKKKNPIAKESKPTDGQKIVRQELERLHAEIANLQILDEVNDDIIKDCQREIDQLQQDVVGYRAVISYLQGRLDGATV